MNTRTTKMTVSFLSPFQLDEVDETLPAGTYDVEIDEELLEGPSFTAYRRTQSYIHMPATPGHGGFTRIFTIDPKALDEALARDQAKTAPPAEGNADQRSFSGTRPAPPANADRLAEDRAENEGMTTPRR